MNFLQPSLLLAGLPLAALPIIIHLINQRRYQSVRWAAMMFLLAANRMSRGYARLRQWLIMALRVLAIAGLAFVVGRPLTGGWLGSAAGGKPDTTIILLDRSPSMRQGGTDGGGSKLDTGKRQLIQTLKTLGSARWVLIDGATNKPRELESIDLLATSPGAEPTSAAADIPGMLQAARDYVQANKSGRTEIWICSDIRANDWNADGGRWQILRDGFREFTQSVRFHLLAYPQPGPDNLSVRVTDVRLQKSNDAAELLVSLQLTREGGDEAKVSVPVQFEIAGARSEVTVVMSGPKQDLKEHRIPLERARERGWGKVSIPADANLADNDFYFTFDQPAPRQTIVVAEDPQTARPLQLAAEISPDPKLKSSAEVFAPDQLATVEWDKVSLLLWEAPLPEGDAAKAVRSFVDRGGYAIFLPPRSAGGSEFFGVRWKEWAEETREAPVENWRGDQDLLANTQSGAALPVGVLQVKRYRKMSGEFTPLATLRGGSPLLTRVTTNVGGAYFCSTTPAFGDSSLANGGVVLYVLVQRALAGGAAVLGNTRQLVAGEAQGEDSSRWKRLSGADEAVSTDFPSHRGVYASGERLLAVNRPNSEDAAPILADGRVAGLFRGLDFSRVDDQAGNISSLIQEIWRLFLAAMMVAMLAEAALCLPRRPRISEPLI